MFIIEYLLSFITDYVHLFVEYYPVFLVGAAFFVISEIRDARRRNSFTTRQ